MSAVLDRLASAGLAPVPAPLAPPGAGPDEVHARGRALLAAEGIGHDLLPWLAAALPELGDGVEALLTALASADPRDAREAGFLLTGLGPGLTPLGDDLLTGAAAAVAALGQTAGVRAGAPRRWASRLAAASREGRTTPASATLIELAATGWAIPPLQGLLDLTPAGERAWRSCLATLGRVGSTSGRGCALAAAAACVLLPGAGKPASTVGIFPMTTPSG
jgi:uncharacterized protein DUF2877